MVTNMTRMGGSSFLASQTSVELDQSSGSLASLLLGRSLSSLPTLVAPLLLLGSQVDVKQPPDQARRWGGHLNLKVKDNKIGLDLLHLNVLYSACP